MSYFKTFLNLSSGAESGVCPACISSNLYGTDKTVSEKTFIYSEKQKS